jgi:hypothetical protein
MAHDYAQRRRVALALAITVIAAPAAFLLNRSSGDDEPVTAGTLETVVGTVAPAGGTADAAVVVPVTEAPDATDALGTAPAGYLSGTTVPGDVDAAQIAVPRLPESVRGLATFSSDIDSTLECHANAAEVPFNATITVTNLDNSRSVQCVSSIGGAPPETTIVLATATFAQIADLTDAPVPVQITWTSD